MRYLQTDVSLFISNDQYQALDSKESQQFECKPLSELALGCTLKFNGSFLNLPLRLYTDSLSLFANLTTLNSTSEKRLLIDLSMLRESYERREIPDVY